MLTYRKKHKKPLPLPSNNALLVAQFITIGAITLAINAHDQTDLQTLSLDSKRHYHNLIKSLEKDEAIFFKFLESNGVKPDFNSIDQAIAAEKFIWQAVELMSKMSDKQADELTDLLENFRKKRNLY